jgi:hypothetical protein
MLKLREYKHFGSFLIANSGTTAHLSFRLERWGVIAVLDQVADVWVEVLL